jgi:hypothetical protein
MDPKATLLAAAAAVTALDFVSAWDHLDYYFEWRSLRGYEPKWIEGDTQYTGDAFARSLTMTIGRHLRRQP